MISNKKEPCSLHIDPIALGAIGQSVFYTIGATLRRVNGRLDIANSLKHGAGASAGGQNKSR